MDVKTLQNVEGRKRSPYAGNFSWVLTFLYTQQERETPQAGLLKKNQADRMQRNQFKRRGIDRKKPATVAKPSLPCERSNRE